MANGLAPYLLADLKSIAGMATPSLKVDMKGLTAMLWATRSLNKPVALGTPQGHKKEQRYWYRQRNTVAQTDTSKSCDNVLTPSRLETTVSMNNTRQIAWHLPDELVASYMEDASARATIPGSTPSTTVSAEMMDIVFAGVNALLGGINQDLINLLVWGGNKANGAGNANTAVTINISKDMTVQPLNNGMTKLLFDYKNNGLTGKMQAVGLGTMYEYILSQAWKGLDMGGVDTRIQAAMLDFYPDQDFATIVGAEHFGIFEPGAIHLVEYLEYTGFKAGNFGVSTFGTMPIPTVDPMGNAVPLMVDFQLKYYDCPVTLTDAYTGASTTYQKGWALMLSKQFGLFQIPTNAYRAEDGSTGVTGALHYIASNNCDTCS